jgi:hypothetical protein
VPTSPGSTWVLLVGGLLLGAGVLLTLGRRLAGH